MDVMGRCMLLLGTTDEKEDFLRGYSACPSVDVGGAVGIALGVSCTAFRVSNPYFDSAHFWRCALRANDACPR